MINENNTTKTIVTVTARIDINKPEAFMNTLRNNARNPLKVLEAQNEAFIVCRPINPDNAFGIAYSQMDTVTCDEGDSWYKLYFDPEKKSLDTAIAEFTAFAKQFFTDKKEELLKQARELERAISNIPLTDLSK
tara:strand:+ start:1482 stop:1883 length:402 start_codon:yes stop_codon:yes gene_type:complete